MIGLHGRTTLNSLTRRNEPEADTMTNRVQWRLRLTFKVGRITDTDFDPAGNFTITGQYDLDGGRVHLTKRYARAHYIYYRGYAEGLQKGIWGIWEIRIFDRGGWHIWPQKYGESMGATEDNGKNQPVESVVSDDEHSPATADVV